MGHPRETNLPHDMGLPRPELAGRETGRGFTAAEVGHPRWEVAGREMGRGIYHSRWELAGRETGRGILPQEMGIQDGNWQIGRREEEFTAGDGTSKGDEFTT